MELEGRSIDREAPIDEDCDMPLVQRPEDDEDGRKASAWVAPDGEWFNIDFGAHGYFAREVFRDGVDYPEDGKAKKELHRRGWIALSDTEVGVAIITDGVITDEQYDVLSEVIGNRELFRLDDLDDLLDEEVVAAMTTSPQG